MTGRTRVALAPLIVVVALLGACGGSPGTTVTATVPPPADAEAVFREFNDAVNAGDAAAAAALVAEDAEFFGVRAADVGVEGLVANVACSAEIVSADVEGDTAVVELDFTGVAPLANQADCPVGTTQGARVTVRDGLIVELTD